MAKNYIQRKPGGLFVTGTRVSLASVLLPFRQGASPETILQKFPALCSLENVYGAIAYYLANESVCNAYLADQANRWQIFEKKADRPSVKTSPVRARVGRSLRSR